MGMLGLAPKADGTGGLSAADHQRIIRAEYAADGILDGCRVDLSSSDMSVTVQAGAVVLPLSAAGAGIGPILQTRLVLDPAPATGADTYDVFASCENVPGASPKVRLVKNSGPAWNDKRLDRIIIPAGVTNAAAGYSASLRDYAVPTNSGQSHRMDYVDRAPFGTLARREAWTNYEADFYLPQDRILEVRMTQTFSAVEGGERGSFQWIIRDSVEGLVVSPVLSYDEWPKGGPLIGGSYQFNHTARFSSGWHHLSFARQQIRGGQPMHAGGQAPSSQGLVYRPFNRLELIDLGVAY